MTDERRLIDDFLDGQLDEAGAVELQRWLAADRAHVREYLRRSALHRGLRQEYLSSQAQEGFAQVVADGPPQRSARPSSRRLATRRRRPFWSRPLLFTALAAGLLLVIGIRLLVPERAGVPQLIVTSGTAELVRQDARRPLRAGDAVSSADVLMVPAGGALALRFADGSLVSLAADSRMTVVDSGSANAGKRLQLTQGRLTAEVEPQPTGHPLVIATPTATATVIGTGFSLTAGAKRTHLEVGHGRVRLQRDADQAVVEVATGEYAVAAPGVALVARRSAGPGDPLRVGGPGQRFLLKADGSRFIMKGAQVDLVLYYPQIGSAYESDLDSDRAVYERAYAGRGAQLDAMKTLGLNTVRILVGGAVALDPNNGYRTAGDGYGGLDGYVRRLVTYADDARARGLHVIFCYSGDDGWSNDAHWSTYQRFIAALVPALADNPDVLFELVHLPDVADQEWSRLSVRMIDAYRALGYRGPLIVGLNHFANWWYEPEVAKVAGHDGQLVFNLHWPWWAPWEKTAELLQHGRDHAVILGEITLGPGGGQAEAKALAVADGTRALIGQGIINGAIARGWNTRDNRPPATPTTMTGDPQAVTPNSWGRGFREHFSGVLPDSMPLP